MVYEAKINENDEKGGNKMQNMDGTSMNHGLHYLFLLKMER